MEEYFWGIDIGGTNVRIGLIAGSGQLAAQADLATQVERGPDSLTDRISQKCSALLVERSIPSKNVKAAGIGCPGLISKEEGKICAGVNFPGFDNFHIRARLSEKLQRPAIMENDANCICWGEFQMGAGREVNDMVLLTLGTGIGGGVISQGELLGGARGNGAELGHMIIHPDGRKCSCGQRGCLEAYASASHTVDRAIEALDHAETSSLMELHRRGGLNCKDIFDHARDGDILAKHIVGGNVQALALAMVTLSHIFESEMFVLTGGLVQAGEILIEQVEKSYQQLVWHIRAEPVQIRTGQLGADAGMIGAAGLARKAETAGTLRPPGR